MRNQALRSEVLRLLRQVPFRPFVLNLENDDRIAIEQPENIACDPAPNGTGQGVTEFYVLSGKLRFFGSFDAVTSVALLDIGSANGA